MELKGIYSALSAKEWGVAALTFFLCDQKTIARKKAGNNNINNNSKENVDKTLMRHPAREARIIAVMEGLDYLLCKAITFCVHFALASSSDFHSSHPLRVVF